MRLVAMVVCAGAAVLVADIAHAQVALAGSTGADPVPGTVTVRLGGRFRAYFGYFADSQFNANSLTYSGDLSVDPTARVFTANEQTGLGLNELARLYPGFDGVTPGGIKYGANVELRQDNPVAPGGGLNGTSSSASRARGSVYVRREWGYLGTDNLGTLRFGTQDGPTALFIAGTMENFNDGGWNGDAGNGLALNAQVVWPFANTGNANVTDKLIYLSPALDMGDIGRFDGGISWEPGTAGASANDGNCPYAATEPGIGCDRLSSTSVALEAARRTNTMELAGRWRAVFGAVGVVGEASYVRGNSVGYQGPLQMPGYDQYNRLMYTPAVTYDGLNFGDMGVALTYAGVQIGANYQFGRFNNATAAGTGSTLALAPKGGKGGSALIAGASYSLGPAVMGASYLSVDTAGAYAYQSNLAVPAPAQVTQGLGTRHETGVAAGGTLKVVPGVGVFLSYLYGERKQSGYDFVASTVGAPANNKTRASVLTLGTSLTW